MDLNVQDLTVSSFESIPKKGTSVSLLGVNDTLVLEKVALLQETNRLFSHRCNGWEIC